TTARIHCQHRPFGRRGLETSKPDVGQLFPQASEFQGGLTLTRGRHPPTQGLDVVSEDLDAFTCTRDGHVELFLADRSKRFGRGDYEDLVVGATLRGVRSHSITMGKGSVIGRKYPPVGEF